MTAENIVTVSDDRMSAVITNADRPGWRVQMSSRRPDGFQPEDLVRARVYEPPPDLLPGQRNTARRWRVFGDWVVYLHWMAGPPTWWFPRLHLSLRTKTGERRLMVLVGWLRRGYGVSVKRRKEAEGEEAA